MIWSSILKINREFIYRTDEPEDVESKPKKKLRAPGGLLHEMEEGETISPQTQSYTSYGGTSTGNADSGGLEMQIKVRDKFMSVFGWNNMSHKN